MSSDQTASPQRAAAHNAVDNLATRMLATGFSHRDRSDIPWNEEYHSWLTKIVTDERFTGDAPASWRPAAQWPADVTDDESVALDLRPFIGPGQDMNAIDRWRLAYWRKVVGEAMHLAETITGARRETSAENIERLTSAVVAFHNAVVTARYDYVEAATTDRLRPHMRAV